jgi:hypothetical protein
MRKSPDYESLGTANERHAGISQGLPLPLHSLSSRATAHTFADYCFQLPLVRSHFHCVSISVTMRTGPGSPKLSSTIRRLRWSEKEPLINVSDKMLPCCCSEGGQTCCLLLRTLQESARPPTFRFSAVMYTQNAKCFLQVEMLSELLVHLASELQESSKLPQNIQTPIVSH